MLYPQWFVAVRTAVAYNRQRWYRWTLSGPHDCQADAMDDYITSAIGKVDYVKAIVVAYDSKTWKIETAHNEAGTKLNSDTVAAMQQDPGFLKLQELHADHPKDAYWKIHVRTDGGKVAML